MKKIISVSIISLFILPLFLLGCSASSGKTDDGKIKVTASISPIKEFTQMIGGDRVDVTSLVPDNVEPHDFEPKTGDYKNVVGQKLFIYNGLGMEPWIDDIKTQIGGTDTNFVDTSKNVDSIDTDGKVDPHVWLSLKQAKVQAANIRDALISVDSDGTDYYNQNYDEFEKKVDSLYSEYKAKFDSVSNKNFMTSHAAFAYLCRDFGLNQYYINDVFGEGEATAKTYETLTNYAKSNHIKTIFSESGDTTKEAETLANEIGGDVKEIYTLETKPENLSYFDAIKFDLDEIYNSEN